MIGVLDTLNTVFTTYDEEGLCIFLSSVIPVVCYNNADTLKKDVLKDNRNKSGVYRWINNINGKSYIGSSISLTTRFLSYYNINHLISNKNMLINRALFKYGYSSFSLIILEYCDPKDCIKTVLSWSL